MAWRFAAISAAMLVVSPVQAQTQLQPLSTPLADLVVVSKSARTLTLYAQGKPIRTYAGVQLGPHPLGPKQVQGDGRTPEGRYVLDYGNPRSGYHLSLHISYPNAQDRAHAAAIGASPGGDIFIHGQPNELRGERVEGDWTAGCIALADTDIDEIWQLVGDGTAIEILP